MKHPSFFIASIMCFMLLSSPVFAAALGYATGSMNITIANVTASAVTNTSTTTTSTSSITTTNLTPDVNANLAIISYSNEISIVQGSNETISLVVKNTNKDEYGITDIKLELKGMESTWRTKPTEVARLVTGKTATISFTISVPVTATIQEVSFKYNVSGLMAGGKVYDVKDAKLRVLPNDATKKIIDQLYTDYSAELIKLEPDVAKLKAEGRNVTKAEILLADGKTKLSEAKTYINNDDYFTAYFRLKDVKDIIDKLKQEIILIRMGIQWWIWAAVAIGVVIVGILAYLFWPVPEEEYEEEGEKEPEEEPEEGEGEGFTTRLQNKAKEYWNKAKQPVEKLLGKLKKK